MTARLLLLYLAVIVGPLALAAALFALRNRAPRRPKPERHGDGRAGSDEFTQTVEEVRP